MTSDVTPSRGPSVTPSRDVTPSRARNVTPSQAPCSRERMAEPPAARSVNRLKIRIAASEVDALREKGYLEAGTPVRGAIEAYSDLLV